MHVINTSHAINTDSPPPPTEVLAINILMPLRCVGDRPMVNKVIMAGHVPMLCFFCPHAVTKPCTGRRDTPGIRVRANQIALLRNVCELGFESESESRTTLRLMKRTGSVSV